jgi:hypothetical protein
MIETPADVPTPMVFRLQRLLLLFLILRTTKRTHQDHHICISSLHQVLMHSRPTIHRLHRQWVQPTKDLWYILASNPSHPLRTSDHGTAARIRGISRRLSALLPNLQCLQSVIHFSMWSLDSATAAPNILPLITVDLQPSISTDTLLIPRYGLGLSQIWIRSEILDTGPGVSGRRFDSLHTLTCCALSAIYPPCFFFTPYISFTVTVF